jgi:hypothetical protein
MTPLYAALERFYFRERALGVAFGGPDSLDLTLGRPSTFLLSSVSSSSGFLQLHLESYGASIYASHFGRGKVLIAQFPFEEHDPPSARPWLAFVRLAAAIAGMLDNPGEPLDPPPTPVHVLRPYPSAPRPRPRVAHAPIEGKIPDPLT